MGVKLLTEHDLEFLSLKGGCTGSSESTFVKIPPYGKSHVTAKMCFTNDPAGLLCRNNVVYSSMGVMTI